MRKPGSAAVSLHTEPPRQSSLSRSSAVALSIRVVGAAGVLLSHVLLARSLGVAGFGEYAQAITWVQVLCVLGKLGLDNASLRYVSEYLTKREPEKLNGFLRDSTRTAFSSSLLLVAVVITVVLALRDVIGHDLASCLVISSVMVPLISLRQIQEAGLRAVGRLTESQISTVVWPLSLAVMVGFVWLTSSSPMPSPLAVCLHLVAIVITCGLVFDFRRHSPLQTSGSTSFEFCRSQWFNTASAFVLAELLIALKTRICVAMAGIQLGRDAAGLYAAMERFADISVLGTQSLGLVIAPQFAALFAAGKYTEMKKLMWHGQMLGLAFTIPVALGVACFGDVIFLLLGSEYREGWGALMALLCSACITAFAGPSAYVLQMTGRERTMLAITALCAVSNVVLSLLLMPPLGILGLGLSQMAISLLWTIGLRLSLRQHPMWQQIEAPSIAASVRELKEAA